MSLILIGDAVYSILYICITDYFIFDDKIIQFDIRLYRTSIHTSIEDDKRKDAYLQCNKQYNVN